MSATNNVRVFCALMRRDMKVLRSRLLALGIDSIILLLLEVLLIGYFFPRMGMPPSLILPLYVGNILFIVVEKTSATAFDLIFDIRDKGLISYLITLPVPKRWIFASYITTELIKNCLLTIPLLLIGLLLLNASLAGVTFSWVACLFYLLVLLFFTLLFFCFAFRYATAWYMVNVWPRRVTPLMATGCIFFPWSSVAQVAPNISKFLLLNPVTYASEGLRAVLLNQGSLIPLPYSFAVLLLANGILMYLLSKNVKQRLDCL